MPAYRDIKIDIVIPAIEKDIGTLPHVIDGVRKHVKHPIGKIFIVSPDSSRIKAVCRRKGCVFVHESRVLPISKKQIVYRSRHWERSGWLYQQLLKLGSSSITEQRHYLVIDADTVLIRPHRFHIAGKHVFYYREWSQPAYFSTYRRLLGKSPLRPHSFVTHYMLFDKVKLRSLKNAIAARHSTTWYKAILQSIDRTKQFGFSEFETYGNYVYAAGSNHIRFLPALNKSLSTSPSRLAKSKIVSLAKRYRSLSFHKRKGYKRSRPLVRHASFY